MIVHHIASRDDVFRYDSNVAFLRSALVPQIDAQRRTLVEAYAEEWPRYFSLFIALATGAPARLAALNASCRQYRPSYLHLNNAKAFFSSGSIAASYASLAVLDFASVEASPPAAVGELEDDYRALVADMRAHADAFLRAFAEGEHELSSFWLRKTRQPVLAVLAVRKRGGALHFFRSMNTEVSMPTGSLCAERAAIAAALASDPSLLRRDLRAVAVLSLPKLVHPDERVERAYEGAGVGGNARSFYSSAKLQQQQYRGVESGCAHGAQPPAPPPLQQTHLPFARAAAAAAASAQPLPLEGVLGGAPSSTATGCTSPMAQQPQLFQGGGRGAQLQSKQAPHSLARSLSSSSAAAYSTATSAAGTAYSAATTTPSALLDGGGRGVAAPSSPAAAGVLAAATAPSLTSSTAPTAILGKRRRRNNSRDSQDSQGSAMSGPGGGGSGALAAPTSLPLVDSELMPPPPPVQRRAPRAGSLSKPVTPRPSSRSSNGYDSSSSAGPDAATQPAVAHRVTPVPQQPPPPPARDGVSVSGGGGGGGYARSSAFGVGGRDDGISGGGGGGDTAVAAGVSAAPPQLRLHASFLPSLNHHLPKYSDDSHALQPLHPPYEPHSSSSSFSTDSSHALDQQLHAAERRSLVVSPSWAAASSSASAGSAGGGPTSCEREDGGAGGGGYGQPQPFSAPRSRRGDRDWGGSDSGTATPVRTSSMDLSLELLLPPGGEVGGGGASAAAPTAAVVVAARPGGSSGGSSSNAGAALTPLAAAVTVPVASNPLLPCGACREWLVKISATNPDFRVLSFTDCSCTAVYVTPLS